jgi:hypothetical protein
MSASTAPCRRVQPPPRFSLTSAPRSTRARASSGDPASLRRGSSRGGQRPRPRYRGELRRTPSNLRHRPMKRYEELVRRRASFDVCEERLEIVVRRRRHERRLLPSDVHRCELDRVVHSVGHAPNARSGVLSTARRWWGRLVEPGGTGSLGSSGGSGRVRSPVLCPSPSSASRSCSAPLRSWP